MWRRASASNSPSDTASTGADTDYQGRLSTFSIENGSTISVITTATGAAPITITEVPSGETGITTVINGETYTIPTATNPASLGGNWGSASSLTPSWSVPLVSSAIIGLLGVVAGAYIAL